MSKSQLDPAAVTPNPAAPKAPALTGSVSVKTRPEINRFCRAGRCFGLEPTVLSLDEVPAATLKAWQAEPRLIVQVTEATQAA